MIKKCFFDKNIPFGTPYGLWYSKSTTKKTCCWYTKMIQKFRNTLPSGQNIRIFLLSWIKKASKKQIMFIHTIRWIPCRAYYKAQSEGLLSSASVTKLLHTRVEITKVTVRDSSRTALPKSASSHPTLTMVLLTCWEHEGFHKKGAFLPFNVLTQQLEASKTTSNVCIKTKIGKLSQAWSCILWSRIAFWQESTHFYSKEIKFVMSLISEAGSCQCNDNWNDNFSS